MTALARLFADERRLGEAVAFCLPGGAPLFLAGETADQLFWLRSGRLAAYEPRPGGDRFLGLIRPGEPAGEISLVAGTSHGASVIALRDSELLALPRADLFAAAQTDAHLMAELARLVATRLRSGPDESMAGYPSVFAFIGLAEGADARRLAERVTDIVRRMGYRAATVGAEAQFLPTEWFSNVENANDFVLYSAEVEERAWRGFVIRQADHLFRIALAAQGLPMAEAASAMTAGHGRKPADLVLVHPRDCVKPVGGSQWFSALEPDRIFHIRRAHARDADRLARIVTGSAVGLVLSGGAARAYAHVGAIRVLRARQVPIDFVAGASMGAIIAAGVAMNWGDEELDRRLRKAFVDSSPVADIAFPLVSLSRGSLMRARLAEHFEDRDICDLWAPFFCVSSNLTTGGYKLHRQGLLREALAASAALPGVLPPVIQGDDVLVDGAIMNNFPADLLHALNPGPIVGVDVTRGRSIEAHDVTPASLWRWLASGDWRKGPPIVSLLMRAATMGTARGAAAARSAADVLILPMVDHIEIRDWRAYDAAVAAGEAAAVEALDRLGRKVVELRRRPTGGRRNPP
jgi:NTE family protein